MDDRGYLYLRGREREEINKGGMKIYPSDIDSVVERFDETTDVCTFAFEEPLQGEDVGIAVVLRSTDDATLRRLYDWARHSIWRNTRCLSAGIIVDEIASNIAWQSEPRTVAQRCAASRPSTFVPLCGEESLWLWHHFAPKSSATTWS